MEHHPWGEIPLSETEAVRLKVALKRLRDACVALDRPLSVLSLSVTVREYSQLSTLLWDTEQRLRSQGYRMEARSPSLFSTTETSNGTTHTTKSL